MQDTKLLRLIRSLPNRVNQHDIILAVDAACGLSPHRKSWLAENGLINELSKKTVGWGRIYEALVISNYKMEIKYFQPANINISGVFYVRQPAN